MTLEKQDKLIFTFCLIDMLFLPYFPLITVAYSMPVVFWWWISRRGLAAYEPEYKLVQAALLLIAISTFISFAVYPQNIKDNVVYLLEMSAIFIYYIMFKYYADNYPINLEKWLFLFVLFVGFFAIIYNIDKSIYQSIKYIWNARMGTQWSVTSFGGYRFGFVWMDENNIAYMINTIAFFLIMSQGLPGYKKLIVFGINLLVVVSSMSSGGRNSLILVWAVYLVLQLFKTIFSGRINNPFSRYVSFNTIISIVLIIIVILMAIKYLPQYYNSTVFLESQERAEGNSLDSRMNIWRYVVTNTKWYLHLFCGHGGRTMVNGAPKAPHNGHFFWIIAYGAVTYLIYIYIFFRKRRNVSLKNWISLLPFFIGFSINTMVGEPKVNEIIAVMVAYMSSQFSLNEYEENNSEVWG